MKIDVKEYNEVSVLNVKGKLMGGPETMALHDKVKDLIGQNRLKIVINLSGVSWMNSTGLGTLMGCLTSLRNAKGDLKLSGVTEKVKSLFLITKLVTIFETYNKIEEAVAAFQKK